MFAKGFYRLAQALEADFRASGASPREQVVDACARPSSQRCRAT
jgi:hypothetical protein